MRICLSENYSWLHQWQVNSFLCSAAFPRVPEHWEDGKKTKSSLVAWDLWNHSHQVRHVVAVKLRRTFTSEGCSCRSIRQFEASILVFAVLWMLQDWFHFMTHTVMEGTDHQQPSTGGLFTNSSCVRQSPPTPLGVVEDAEAPLIVPEGLYAHVDCKSDIDCLCSASH